MTLVHCLDNPSAHGCGAPSLCCKWWKGKLHRWQTKSCVCDHQTSRASVGGSGWKVVRQTAWQRSGHVGSDLEGEVSSSGPRTFFYTGLLRSSCRAGTGLGYDSVPPRTLNELSDQGIDASVDLVMRIEAECGWLNKPLQPDRLRCEGCRRRQARWPPVCRRARAVHTSAFWATAGRVVE